MPDDTTDETTATVEDDVVPEAEGPLRSVVEALTRTGLADVAVVIAPTGAVHIGAADSILPATVADALHEIADRVLAAGPDIEARARKEG